MSEWTDQLGTSTRPDGAKIGEFPRIDGAGYEWFFFPPGWTWRRDCPIEALGPFNSREEAKVAGTS